jgi:hypothetical protein
MKSLEDLNYKLIKAHILDPDNSPLSLKHQDLLDRIVCAAKLLAKNPYRKHAVALHRYRFSHISRSQAYADMNFADRMVNTIHTFDYDMWRDWIINSILQNIEECKCINTSWARQIIDKEHANLIKVLGSKPIDNKDPNHSEMRQFHIIINLSKNRENMDFDEILKMPNRSIRDLNIALGLTKKKKIKKQVK